MRVATFNIHHGTVAKDGPVDPRQLAEVCASFDADVLALEEVDLGTYRTGRADLAAIVARACAMEHVFGPARRFPGGWYGNALLVRGAVRSWSDAPLPRVPAWRRWQERRIGLEAQVVVDGTELGVVVTHLAVEREVSSVQLHELLRRAGRTRPTVVLGDLNLRPSVVKPMAEAAGFTVVDHAHTSPAPGPPNKSIDHVVVSAGVTVTASDVRVTPMSDHAALLVDLVVDPVVTQAVGAGRDPRAIAEAGR